MERRAGAAARAGRRAWRPRCGGGKPSTWHTHYLEETAKPFEQWFGGLVGSGAGIGLLRATGVGEALLLEHVASQAAAPLRVVQNALKQRGNVRVTPLAHCFCSAP